jgi:hypothetical protein
MSAQTVQIRELDENKPLALYARYQGQSERQDCYLELDIRTGAFSADYNGEIGNAVPFPVWHGLIRRYTIPCLRAAVANRLMVEVAPLAQAVLDGAGAEWDGHNTVARLSNDAQSAEQEIEAIIERHEWSDDTVQVWDAADWFGGLGGSDAQRAEMGITSSTTDEELQAIIDAERDRVDVLHGGLKHLRDLRDRADA